MCTLGVAVMIKLKYIIIQERSPALSIHVGSATASSKGSTSLLEVVATTGIGAALAAHY
jgi:hypothetical protein